MKHNFLLWTLLLIPSISSCDRPSLPVKDASFLISAAADADMTMGRMTVTLTLDKGDVSQTYSVAYCIDDDETLHLSDRAGDIISRKTSVSFEDFPYRTWVLPTLTEGEHTISFKIKSEEYVQDIVLPFAVVTAPFRAHVEISTPARSLVTMLVLNLVEGSTDKLYTGRVYIDGALCDEKGFSVNFSDNPTLMLELPLVRPGEHSVRVDLSDGTRTERAEVRYNEPLRHPDLHIHISHDDNTGYTRFMVEQNPYGLSVEVKDSCSVCGLCKYFETTSPSYYKQVSDSMQLNDMCLLERFIPGDGEHYNLINKDILEKRITSSGHKTTVWGAVWRTDSEGYWDYIEVEGPFVPFEITSSEQFITARSEIVDGITVHVLCTEKGCFYNGVALDGDEYLTPLR